MWWAAILGVLSVAFWIIVPVVTETIAENKEIKMMNNEEVHQIFDCRSLGLCESCDYSIDNCMKDGKALCKQKEVITDEEKSI